MRILIGATARASGFRKTSSHSGCLCYQPPLRGNFMGLPGLCRRKWAIDKESSILKASKSVKWKRTQRAEPPICILYRKAQRERGSVWPRPPNLLAVKLMLTRSQASNSISPALPTPASLSRETVLLPCQPTNSVTIPPSPNLAVNPSQPSSSLQPCRHHIVLGALCSGSRGLGPVLFLNCFRCLKEPVATDYIGDEAKGICVSYVVPNCQAQCQRSRPFVHQEGGRKSPLASGWPPGRSKRELSMEVPVNILI